MLYGEIFPWLQVISFTRLCIFLARLLTLCLVLLVVTVLIWRRGWCSRLGGIVFWPIVGPLVVRLLPVPLVLIEVPRVLFLGICLDFYYCLRRVLVPKFGFHFDRGSVSQALVKPRLVPP